MTTSAETEGQPAGRDGSRRPLVLGPFRGLRFDPDATGDLGSVVSPPYDLLDAATVQRLERANQHNVVRLILSRYFEPPYQAVRRRLESWRDRGVLRADDAPALYLYEYVVGGQRVRGLIGLVELRAPDEGVVLPHEDVMPGPVDDRALLMRTTETNLEPILLVHPGSTALTALLDEVEGAAPAAAFTAVDGSSHRLWAITDQHRWAEVARLIAPEQALIADGHHRYAAYLRLQRERGRDPEATQPGPWDLGLALLVARNETSLTVGPIHRVVAGLTLADVAEVAADRADLVNPVDGRGEALAALEEAEDPQHALFALSDGARWALLSSRRSSPIDAAVLHQDLLVDWRAAEEQISYHHSVPQALEACRAAPAVAVFLRAPSLADVTAAAAHGHRLPRKSTSFTPKPSMGVVMRDLRDS